MDLPNEFIVQDTFFISGKGFVFYIDLPIELEGRISVGDEIMFDDDESFNIIQIERARNSIGFSRNVGLLISGDLKHNKNQYSNKKFTQI